MEKNIDQQIAYERAKKRVKAVKGFYIHALVFVLVIILNVALLVYKDKFSIEKFYGFGLWLVGLSVHGLSVFLPNFVLGKDWEERKIREIMEKNKRS